jgi:hypothetical protein
MATRTIAEITAELETLQHEGDKAANEGRTADMILAAVRAASLRRSLSFRHPKRKHYGTHGFTTW